MKDELNMKNVIFLCIGNILNREQKEYAKLKEIYEEVAAYLEVENDYVLQSKIRGRLQENCEQYSSFIGEPLFLTEKVRSGNWTININKKKCIRYLYNTYLITNDNWLSAEKVKTISETYEEETNESNIFKAKLLYTLGKDKTLIIINELNKINILLKDLKNIQTENSYGLAFEVFAVSVIHNIEYEECINKNIIHGNLDGGIDAIVYSDINKVFVYQIKIGNIKDNAYERMRKSYDDCATKKQSINDKHLYNFINKHRAELEEKKPQYYTVSDNSLNEHNYKPIDIYNKFFENKLLPQTNNNITLNIIKPKLDNHYNVSKDEDNNFIFFLTAKDLVSSLLAGLGMDSQNYDKNKIDLSKYFTDNVRGVLSVNKKMVNTIEKEPKNFLKYNNGINITGEVKDLEYKIMVKNPIINNGQQTITTLIKTEKNLDQINLTVKVTNENKMPIKSKISQFSNEQVKVKSIDILSLNSFIREIQTKIYHNNNYFLQIYSSGKKSYYDVINKLYKPNNIIELLDFIKLYFSVKNKKELGAWKNSPNYQIEQTSIDFEFDEATAIKVCESISRYKNYIESIKSKKERDDFKSADLAFKYLICKENLSEIEAAKIIKTINQKYYYDLKDEKSKLIDIYKSNTIINKLEEEIEKKNFNKIAI